MPRSRPKAYSTRVRKPTRATVTPHARTTRRFRRSGGSGHSSTTPASRKAAAALAFIETAPGRTLFRNGMSSAQPRRTKPPTVIEVAPIARVTAGNDAEAVVKRSDIRRLGVRFGVAAHHTTPERRTSRGYRPPLRGPAPYEEI